jgi:threonyl-tRNA synthetase
MLVVGDREAQTGTVAVRLRKAGDQGAVTLNAFLERAGVWNAAKSLEMPWAPSGETKEP